jgi:cell division protease FtsH
MLEDNRLQVLAVAHALESFKTITGEDVQAIIHGRPGPFIDGRRYHTPEFLKMAEEYRRKIVEVHKDRSNDRSNDPIALPVVAGLSITEQAEHAEPVELAGAFADRESFPSA